MTRTDIRLNFLAKFQPCFAWKYYVANNQIWNDFTSQSKSFNSITRIRYGKFQTEFPDKKFTELVIVFHHEQFRLANILVDYDMIIIHQLFITGIDNIGRSLLYLILA